MYHIMDYVGSYTTVAKTILVATEQPDTTQGQAALRMLQKRHFKNFNNQFKLKKSYPKER